MQTVGSKDPDAVSDVLKDALNHSQTGRRNILYKGQTKPDITVAAGGGGSSRPRTENIEGKSTYAFIKQANSSVQVI